MIRTCLFLSSVMLSATVLTGCQQTITTRLVGQWIGHPDTAAAAAERSAKLKARQQDGARQPNDLPNDDQSASAKLGVTDLENYDVSIRLHFHADKTVRMSLADGSQVLSGVWRVVTTLPPSGAEIEISLTGSGQDDAGGESPQNEKRRFIIDFQENGVSPGFTLVEKGADPQFGRMYFAKTNNLDVNTSD